MILLKYQDKIHNTLSHNVLKVSNPLTINDPSEFLMAKPKDLKYEDVIKYFESKEINELNLLDKQIGRPDLFKNKPKS